jgi:hypothetical protein
MQGAGMGKSGVFLVAVGVSYVLCGWLYYIADFHRSLLSLDAQFALSVLWALIEAAVLVWRPRLFLITLPQLPLMSYVIHTIAAQSHCIAIGILHPGCAW